MQGFIDSSSVSILNSPVRRRSVPPTILFGQPTFQTGSRLLRYDIYEEKEEGPREGGGVAGGRQGTSRSPKLVHQSINLSSFVTGGPVQVGKGIYAYGVCVCQAAWVLFHSANVSSHEEEKKKKKRERERDGI